MDREKLIDQIMNAQTADEIKSAKNAALSHLAENPDDIEVRLAMEQLAMMRFATS